MTLAERLRAARRDGSRLPAGPAEPGVSGQSRAPGSGPMASWSPTVSAANPVDLLGLAPPGWEVLPDACLRLRTSHTWDGPDVISHLMSGHGPRTRLPISALRFFDLETTGLSGGAGTAVFLAGIGRVRGGALEIEQRLISDFPAERGIVEWFAQESADSVLWVSYNGRSFDGPVLENRAIIHRSSVALAPHLDLLRFTRRFWKHRMPSCSLGAIESGVLNHFREQDIPSALVPEVFLAWLDNREAVPLQPVLAHHREDILSLARITVMLEQILASPLAAGGVDRSMLARCLMEEGRLNDALLVLDRSISQPDPDAPAVECMRCCRMAARLHARNGQRELALRAARIGWEQWGDPVCGRFLAVDREHRERNYPAAQRLTQQILELHSLPGWLMEDLRRRLRRLERKLSPADTD